ncbi:hypothetical protein ACCO45_009356 [Purpureocillium lilacinum]|uniref:Uncharacterized protein n=1 Tax=Purpureocillium lilacinum TaxID=33203 RepID=A0ACC4DMF2_PURLI
MRWPGNFLTLATALQAAGNLAASVHHRCDQQNQALHTWWHEKPAVNDAGAVAADEVRQSRKYDVSVSVRGESKFRDSFVYETIPRNGNGKMYDPANPGQEYNLADGDGITVEEDAKINMAWTQFQYAKDVEVRITSKDGSALGPTSNVVIRPSDISPFIPQELIPSKTSGDTQVLKPGKITDSTIGAKPTLYFEAGTYWVEKDGRLGKSHIKLNANTHYVYFEPGTYIKGAFEYTHFEE